MDTSGDRRASECADELRSALVDGLEPFADVELAVLFGSAARGRVKPDDIDVGIVVARGDTSLVQSVENRLGRALCRRVDVAVLNDAPPLLRFEVARDGQVLTERRPGAWSDFRARAMIDWWDWAPTARFIWKRAARRLTRTVGFDREASENAHGPA